MIPLAYVVRRLLVSILTLLGVSVLTFLLAWVVPSKPAMTWVGPHATAEQLARAEKELGLDKPVWQRYWLYLGGLIEGNWGVSIRTHRPVLQDISTYLPATVELLCAGMFIAVLLGVPLGVLSAAKPGTLLDHVSRTVAIAGVGLPTFWLAMILQLIFFKYLGLFPLGKRIGTITAVLHPVEIRTGFYLLDSILGGNLVVFKDAAWHLVLPAVTVAAYALGLTMRMTRATMLEVLGEDYIRTSRAFGIRESRVLFRYALRNAARPVVTSLALTFAYSLTGTFLIEAVFVWPGLGNYAADSIMSVDTPAIMGIVFLVASTYILLNLVADLVIGLLDPRISDSGL